MERLGMAERGITFFLHQFKFVRVGKTGLQRKLQQRGQRPTEQLGQARWL